MWTTRPRSKAYSFLGHHPHPGSHTQSLPDLKVLGQHRAARETRGPPFQDGISDSNGGISGPKWCLALVLYWGDSEAKRGQRVDSWSHSTMVVWPPQRWFSLSPHPTPAQSISRESILGFQARSLPPMWKIPGKHGLTYHRRLCVCCPGQGRRTGMETVGSWVFCPPNFSAMWETPPHASPPGHPTGQ